MKNLVIVLVSLASLSAFAAPQSASITSVNVDPNAFSSERFISGSIVVDTATRQAELSLFPEQIRCAPGRVCPMLVLAPIHITLPLVSRQTDGCGEVFYIAQSDQRATDGILRRLTIVDHSHYSCSERIGPTTVGVKYETDGFDRVHSRDLHTVSTFEASAFVYAQE